MKPISILLMGLVAGAAAGGIAGWQIRDSKEKEPAKNPSAVLQNSSGGVQESSAFHEPGAAAGGQSKKDADAKKENANSDVPVMDRLISMAKGAWDEDKAAAMLAGMSETELAAMIASASSIKGRSRWLVYQALYVAWAKIHPEAALARAVKASNEQEQRGFMNIVMGEWASTDPRRAMEAALNLGKINQRNNCIQAVVRKWADKDIQGTLDYLTQHPELPGSAQLFMQALTPYGQEMDSATFARKAALAQQYTSGDNLRNIVSNLVQQWAMDEPADALNYVNTINNPELKRTALQNVYSSWASRDLEAALASAQQLQDPVARDSSVQGVFSQWMSSDPVAAAEYAVKSGSPALLEQLANESYAITSNLTPKEADAVLSRMPDGEAKNRMTQSLTYSLIRDADYDRAVKLTQLMTNPDQRNRSLFDIASSWSKTEPAEVEDWLRQFPVSPERDSVLAGYIANVAARSPADAITWSESLESAGRKAGARLNIAFQWMRQSPAKAEAWMTTAKFTADERKRVTDAINRGGTTVFSSSTGWSHDN